MNTWLNDYIGQMKSALASIPLSKVEQLILQFQKALAEDRQIFVCGNGGSASNASHFITDLGKGASDKLPRRFRCLTLNDNISWMTALGNDYAYDEIFQGQLQNFARPGDLLFMMSVSGNSPNLVKAAQWAKDHQVRSIALVGAKRGRLAELCNDVIVIDSTHYGRVEDAHMTICHLICYAFMEKPELAAMAV
jgi:D-sedoheptulose 7-phosphate isomerase